MPALALSRAGARVVELADRADSGDPDTGPAGQGLPEDAWDRLEQVRDPRSPQGRIYPLPCLLAIAVCAFTAAGHDRLTAAGQWIKRASQDDLARLRAPWDQLAGVYRAPDEKTIRVVLDRVDPAELTRALLGPRRRPGRVRTRTGQTPSQNVRAYRDRRRKHEARLVRSRLKAVAVDGKSSRGARRADGRRVHLLGVAEHASSGGNFLSQAEVDVKHNETTHLTALLKPLDLTGQVVTFDALHTVRGNLDWLVSTKHAHYIAVIKKNQPLLHQRVKALPWKDVPAGQTTRDHGHGRDETRSLKTAHVDGLDLPGARQAIKITRWRQNTKTLKVSRETVYAVTSLTSAEATAEDLAQLVREHWGIEVLHHIRDITFTEDHSTSRTGHGPINLATIRSAITNTIRNAGYLHIPEGRRDHTTAAEALYLHGLT